MQLMRETRSMFKNTPQWRTLEAILAVLSLISGCFSISVVPFIRRDFGERYLSWLNLAFGYTVVANFTFVGAAVLEVISAFTHRQTSSPQLMILFWLAFIGMSIYRRLEINRKNNAGLEWHSMYIGTSVLPLPVSPEKIFKFFEPALVFAVGHFLWQFSGQVGLWLMISSAALLINNHIVFFNERRAMLDMRDAQIEAKYMQAALAGKPAHETAGFVVAESSMKLMAQDASLKDAFTNLSPDFREIIDSGPEAQEEGRA